MKKMSDVHRMIHATSRLRASIATAVSSALKSLVETQSRSAMSFIRICAMAASGATGNLFRYLSGAH